MNQDPKRLPPEVEAEMLRRMAAGQPLPPGVIARQGAAPMPGAMPMPGGAPPSAEDIKKQSNPIPHGDEGRALIREQSTCDLAPEATRINAVLPAIMDFKTDDEKIHSEIDDLVGRGLIAGLRGKRHCENQFRTRVVCNFSKDEKLSTIAADLAGIEEEMTELERKIQETVARGRALLKERFEYATSTYGLATDKYYYWIDEDAGTIESVSLDCEGCKGSSNLKKARKNVEELHRKIYPKPQGVTQ